jgi:hypothetical protein
MTLRSIACRAALLAGFVALTTMPAAAQRALNPKPLTAAKPEQQPAALPGADGGAVKADRNAAKVNLPPNEALFDGVNRGDLPAVREAMNRGASLEARNVLGLTAIELSVDLGRNPITFFLLSVRAGTEGTGPAPALASEGAAKKVAAAQVPQVAPRPVVPAPVPVQVARPVVSHDPGTPVPQAGFLGFGASR